MKCAQCPRAEWGFVAFFGENFRRTSGPEIAANSHQLQLSHVERQPIHGAARVFKPRG